MQQLGYMSTLIIREPRLEDVIVLQKFLRMPPKLFDEILER